MGFSSVSLAIFWKNTEMKIDLDQVPRNLDEAVDAIMAGLEPGEREHILAYDQDYSTHWTPLEKLFIVATILAMGGGALFLLYSL